MLCIKHNEDAGFARSPVGPRAEIFKKAHKNHGNDECLNPNDPPSRGRYGETSERIPKSQCVMDENCAFFGRLQKPESPMAQKIGGILRHFAPLCGISRVIFYIFFNEVQKSEGSWVREKVQIFPQRFTSSRIFWKIFNGERNGANHVGISATKIPAPPNSLKLP